MLTPRATSAGWGAAHGPARGAAVPAALRQPGAQRSSATGSPVSPCRSPSCRSAAACGDVALTSTAQFLPFVLLAIPAGVWADRWDRKRILISSDLVRLVTQSVAAVLLLSGQAEVVHLAVLAAVFGSADAFFAPAFSGLLPTTVSPGNIQPANALRGLTLLAGERRRAGRGRRPDRLRRWARAPPSSSTRRRSWCRSCCCSRCGRASSTRPQPRRTEQPHHVVRHLPA